MTTREVGLIERLREPDSHDPECPFNERCYCADGAPHDNVQDDIRLEAADALTALSSERDLLREAIRARDKVIAAAADAIDEADNIISINLGTDTPEEWNRAFRKVAKARAALTGVTGG